MDSLIQRLQSGSGPDMALSMAISNAVQHRAELLSQLLSETDGPGLCLALVREKLPAHSHIQTYFPSSEDGKHWSCRFWVMKPGTDIYDEFGAEHPELPRAILIALLIALEADDG